MASKNNKLGLVLSGGGARGAYEAGVLHYVRTMLPSKSRNRNFDIQSGSSVGAINTCFMVATAHDLNFQAKKMWELWENIREENIYKRNFKALLEFLSKGSKQIFFKFLRGLNQESPHFPGFLDTSPFLPFISNVMDWPQISKNIQKGFVQAIAIVATNVFTGRTELFIEKNSKLSYYGDYTSHFTTIQPVHALASAAIPIVFPSILINGIAYTDGGLRLNTPISPAIHLGADSILVIGLNHRARAGEEIPFHGVKGQPPALGQILGRVLNSVFLDKIQYDLEQLERINRIVEWAELLYGKNFLDDLNKMLVEKNIHGDIADRGVKKLKLLRIRPSEDIGEMFIECFQKSKDHHFGSFEKFLIRVLDIDPSSGNDFLSYIGFIPEYLQKLLALGFEDAKTKHNELKEFLED
ncbi:MAG: patatin-like phospholipase family protein [Deltaproteobacteria bacterium]|nr:patatin-like phospholipase family protein [Deltaproteobacteria bacterium]